MTDEFRLEWQYFSRKLQVLTVSFVISVIGLLWIVLPYGNITYAGIVFFTTIGITIWMVKQYSYEEHIFFDKVYMFDREFDPEDVSKVVYLYSNMH